MFIEFIKWVGKRDKMWGFQSILSLFHNKYNKLIDFDNTSPRLNPLFHKLWEWHETYFETFFGWWGRENIKILSLRSLQRCYGRHYIKYTRWVSFDIKFTRQGFEKAFIHRKACRAIQHAFLKQSLLTWYQKTQTWYSIYQFTYRFTLQTIDYDVLFNFCVISASLETSFKKCNVIMTW